VSLRTHNLTLSDCTIVPHEHIVLVALAVDLDPAEFGAIQMRAHGWQP
jgi:hypothetical protein